MSELYHIPVMVGETLSLLEVRSGGSYFDCTLGGGGHSEAILRAGGIVTAVDRDPEAVEWSEKRLSAFGSAFSAHVARFSRIRDMAGDMAGRFDGVIMDLGLSSRMIDDPAKGFSYRHDGPLLMDMGGAESSARDMVNGLSRAELVSVFHTWGEEHHAARIADAIVRTRDRHPVETTGDLARIVEDAVGGSMPQKSKARIFQALRIVVNDEIGELRTGLDGALAILKPGGRLCVIAYHSIEDREVKNFMRDRANPCICPKNLPECGCGREAELVIVAKRPVRPSEAEIAANERARSAILRAAKKTGGVR